MNRFDNDPTPVRDPETIADPTSVSGPITPRPALIERPRINSSVDCSLDELRQRQLRVLPDLEFHPAQAEPEFDEEDETVVSFPRVDVPRLDPVPVPAPPRSKPGSTTGPRRALQQELFEDLPEIDADPPPPLMIAPRPKVARRRLKTDARRGAVRRVDLLMLTIAFLGGVIAASVVFLTLIYLRPPPESPPPKAKVQPPKAPKAVSRRTEPAPKPIVPAQPAVIVAPRPAPTPAPEPDEPSPARHVASPSSEPDPPAVTAGKNLARALEDCQLKHRGQSLRLGVWLRPDGQIRKVFAARRRWIGKSERRCIRRRLMGIKLGGLQSRGYIEWHLWLGRYPDATLLRHIQ
jgi:hypothetical protein